MVFGRPKNLNSYQILIWNKIQIALCWLKDTGGQHIRKADNPNNIDFI